jgi:hypothetical protein
MLNAILRGKARCLAADLKAGQPWRSVFRSSEDLLTAAVFERLAYLDGSTFWQVLRRAIQPDLLPPRTVAELEECTFWPRWLLSAGQEQGLVEPDIYLRFKIGDPPAYYSFIVEAKLRRRQSARQWAQEWSAYQQILEEEHHPQGETLLLAIGGLDRTPGWLPAMVKQANLMLREPDLPKLRAASIEWGGLLKAVLEACQDNHDPRSRCVLDDIVEALGLHGYRDIQLMASLSDVARPFHNISQSMDTLARWNFPEKHPAGQDYVSPSC